jgi:hypothetical protein
MQHQKAGVGEEEQGQRGKGDKKGHGLFKGNERRRRVYSKLTGGGGWFVQRQPVERRSAAKRLSCYEWVVMRQSAYKQAGERASGRKREMERKRKREGERERERERPWER